MLRHRSAWFAIALLILTSLACNAFAGAELEPTLELPPPAVTNQEGTITPTVDGPAPTATLPGDVDETADVSSVASLNVLVDLNVRNGPGVIYDRVGFLLQGETARIIGVDPATRWWKIECPPRAEGTECWVSGGSQFSAASNTEAVPVAPAPPPPTPAATASPTPTPGSAPDTGGGSNVVVGGSGLLAYADNSGLWLAPLDTNANPPAAGEFLQIVGDTNITQVLLAPDGQKIAYLTAATEANALHVVNVDGSERRTLVNSGGLPIAAEGDVSTVAALIDNVQWRPNSQALVFNTIVVNLVGPGASSQEDLWSVRLDGSLTERFAAGEGGGAFAVSAGNRVLMAQAEHIVRANWDGSGWEEVIEFDFVNTASEYVYYPRPQWTADGSRAYVAIPSAEQFSPEASVDLWQVPATGPAEMLATLPGNVLFNPVIWSPNGNALAYVQQLISAANPPPELVIAGSSGQSPASYDMAPQLTFHGWAPNSSHFLYSGPDFYAAGRMGAAPTVVAVASPTAAMQWLNASSFVVATGSAGAWNLQSANLAGEAAGLATVNSQFPVFDVWAP